MSDSPLDWLPEDEEPSESVDTPTSALTHEEQRLISDLADMAADHEVRIEALEVKEEKQKNPRAWIERHQTVEEWAELALWVDWLNDNYSMPDSARVPPCWPAHPGQVHALAGLRAAWRAAVLADEQSKEVGNAVAAFHDYHLFPFFNRLGNKQWFPCVANQHTPDETHERTNRECFPPGLASADTGELPDDEEE